jgi:carboxymethylenebutenolidase
MPESLLEQSEIWRYAMLRTTLFLALTLAFLPPARAGEMVKLNDNADKPAMAYADGPEDAARAILVVHDYFGISPATKKEVERLAKVGYRVMAVDLYQGQAASEGAEAEKLMKALDPGHAQAAISLALDKLQAEKRKTGILGFSMGGKIALEGMLGNQNRVVAAASIYGGSFEDLDEAKLKSAGPMLIVTGSKDEWSYPSLIALQERMRKLEHPVATFVYPNADHGYAQPFFMGGKNLDQGSIDATQAVVDQFFAKKTAGE